MKELIKKSWFVFLLGILIAVVVLFGIGVILYCNGYRIVYPEQFETSWDAVSGFAAWFGVAVSILSAAASFAAIWFAVRVADKQNKIALFEKRYNCYLVVQNLLLCGKRLRKATYNDTTYAILEFYLKKSVGSDKLPNSVELMLATFEIKDKIEPGAFLFSKFDVDFLDKILDKGKDLGLAVYKMDPDEGKKELTEKNIALRDEYCELCDEFRETYFETMTRELNLV